MNIRLLVRSQMIGTGKFITHFSTLEILHTRCTLPALISRLQIVDVVEGVSILADLWHAPSAKNAIGTATTGSSEAAQLGGLAMKKIWQERRKAAGKSIHEPGSAYPT